MSDLLNSASLVMIPSGYKEDVVYSQIPTSGAGDLSFTRASNGTRINSAGLVEVVAWNLLEQSETFDNAVWTKQDSSITANATTAPNGTLTADKLVENTSTSAHSVWQPNNLPNQTYTYSFYAKASERVWVYTRGDIGLNYFNVSTGVVGTTSAGATSTIENVGNGWYRCIVTKTFQPQFNTQIAISTADNINSYTGDGTSGLYIWGAQLNIGATAKPYFPTTDRLNVPRLTYQNGGGGCPSLLLEKQSTNLAIQSNTFNTSPWAMFAGPAVTPNSTISPDGTQNATTLNSSGGVNDFLYQTITGLTTGATYAFSVYVKNINSTASQLWGAATGTAIMYINWSGETLTSVSGTGSSFVAVGNGWYRITSTTATAGTGSTVRIYADGNNTSKSIYIYGAQFEAGSYPTSYIPTTSSSATRVADACFKTGISSLIGQTEGTMFADVVPFENIVNDVIALNLSVNNSVAITMSNSIIKGLIFNSGNLFIMSGGSYTKGNRYKIAVVYKNNNSKIFVNGALINTDTSNVVFNAALNDLYNYPTNYYEGANNIKFNSTQLYKTALTDAECQALTTI